MKKKSNRSYDRFNEALLKTTVAKDGWHGLKFLNTEPTLDLWNSMSIRSKGRVVSDSRWNHYPMWSYTKTSKKRFGRIVSTIIKEAFDSDDKDTLRVLTNKAEGVFAIYALDSAPSSMRVKMAKRLKNSPDNRVKTRCAKILPVKYMPDLLHDKSYSVRSVAINRIGLDNCYKSFIPTSLSPSEGGANYWYRNWLARQALRLSDKGELSGLIDEAKSIDSEELKESGLDMIVSALLSRLTPEESLYFIDLGENNPYIKRVLKQKIDRF